MNSSVFALVFSSTPYFDYLVQKSIKKPKLLTYLYVKYIVRTIFFTISKMW